MHPIERVLTLWHFGLLDSSAVIAWADRAILAADVAPQALIDLACDGPEACMQRTEFQFPARPVPLSFSQAFALKALTTRLDADDATLAFARWAARAAMDEDATRPEVALSYRLDHGLNDCQNPAEAIALVRRELPALLPRCREWAAPFLQGHDALSHRLGGG